MADHTAMSSLSTFEDDTAITTGAKPTQYDRVTTPTHDLDPKLSLLLYYDILHSINKYPESPNFISRISRLPVAQLCSNGVAKEDKKLAWRAE